MCGSPARCHARVLAPGCASGPRPVRRVESPPAAPRRPREGRGGGVGEGSVPSHPHPPVVLVRARVAASVRGAAPCRRGVGGACVSRSLPRRSHTGARMCVRGRAGSPGMGSGPPRARPVSSCVRAPAASCGFLAVGHDCGRSGLLPVPRPGSSCARRGGPLPLRGGWCGRALPRRLHAASCTPRSAARARWAGGLGLPRRAGGWGMLGPVDGRSVGSPDPSEAPAPSPPPRSRGCPRHGPLCALGVAPPRASGLPGHPTLGRQSSPLVAHRAPTWLILPVAYACLKD